jgi:hypothetical protein
MCTSTASSPVRQPLAEQIVASFAATVIDDLPIPAGLAKLLPKEQADQLTQLRHSYRLEITALVLRKAVQVVESSGMPHHVGSHHDRASTDGDCTMPLACVTHQAPDGSPCPIEVLSECGIQSTSLAIEGAKLLERFAKKALELLTGWRDDLASLAPIFSVTVAGDE